MKQHFVPKCYLNEFTSLDGDLITLDLPLFVEGRKPHIRTKKPTQIGYEIDVYTLDKELPFNHLDFKNKGRYLIEQDIFWRYENEYPFIMQQIRNRQPLPREKAEIFVHALISMKLRNKFILNPEKQKNLLKKVISEGKNEMIEKSMELFPEMSAEEKLEIIEQVEKDITTNNAFVKGANLVAMIEREIGRRSIINDIAKKLINCEWKILESDFSAMFITSDNPGFCFDRGFNPHNTKFDECTFIFPLTPMLCLSIHDRHRDINYQSDPSEKQLLYQPVSAELITLINTCSTVYCNKYILSQTRQTMNSFLGYLSLLKAS